MNGQIYFGKWKDFKAHDTQGEMKYPNGDICKGNFENDTRQGICVTTRPSGWYTEANYKNDVIFGRYEIKNPEGKTTYYGYDTK